MPEQIVALLKAIEAKKGREYVAGLVDMANLLSTRKEEADAAGRN